MTPRSRLMSGRVRWFRHRRALCFSAYYFALELATAKDSTFGLGLPSPDSAKSARPRSKTILIAWPLGGASSSAISLTHSINAPETHEGVSGCSKASAIERAKLIQICLGSSDEVIFIGLRGCVRPADVRFDLFLFIESILVLGSAGRTCLMRRRLLEGLSALLGAELFVGFAGPVMFAMAISLLVMVFLHYLRSVVTAREGKEIHRHMAPAGINRRRIAGDD